MINEENITHITNVLKKHFPNLSVQQVLAIVFEILRGLKKES